MNTAESPILVEMNTSRGTINLELFADLYWEFRLWVSHDSDPPAEGALNTDYGLVSSLGYSW